MTAMSSPVTHRIIRMIDESLEDIADTEELRKVSAYVRNRKMTVEEAVKCYENALHMDDIKKNFIAYHMILMGFELATAAEIWNIIMNRHYTGMPYYESADEFNVSAEYIEKIEKLMEITDSFNISRFINAYDLIDILDIRFTKIIDHQEYDLDISDEGYMLVFS